MTTKDELLGKFDGLAKEVEDFAKPSVATEPTDVIDHHGIRQPGGNPGVTSVQGEESLAGHVRHYLDIAKAHVAEMVGKDAE